MRFLGNNRTVFRVFGFPIKIHPTWLLLLGLIVYSLAGKQGLFRVWLEDEQVGEIALWFLGLVGATGLFASLIAHELCHSLVARRTGLPVRGITLFVFGGVSELGDMPATPASEFLMAVVGPLSSLVIAGCCGVVRAFGTSLGLPDITTVLFRYLAYVNVVLALFNSVPAFPLDGGRILRSILWGISGDLRAATTVAVWVGSGFGITMIVGGVIMAILGGIIPGIWFVFIGFFLSQAARGSLRQVIMRDELMGEWVDYFMKRHPVTVRPDTSLRGFVDDYVLPYHVAIFPVVDEEGRLMGIVRSRDPAQVERADWDILTVRDVMSDASEEITIAPHTTAVEAFARLAGEQGSHLVVVQDNRPVGIVSLRDLFEFLALKIDLGSRRR